MRLLLTVFIILLLTTPPSWAEACYTKQEAEAEQGIRIHSELMVIGLNCQHMATANGKNLYDEHRRFTQKHADLFATYEKIIMLYLKKNGDKNPEATLNKMRTDFANKISNDAAEMRPDIFCRSYAPRIEKAAKMDRETLRRWAATIFPSHPVSHPICKDS
ncbi:MAG: hypothetical protein KDI61_09050 [Alphaproteobacteria bacterium]|nr:hypothetical protein [Alphaproteobacteria bacterium]MCB1840394.1 hypothetical protein [Alphaproteobacteria bacterium]